ncbi:FAD-binding oxidoreductase [Salinihabitans flavidus]|uniref:NAD(P)/FAD-dependent oxidoreductase n=1 Tax=Salinihabitans flavidus TaxID=569882 RepID=UPI003183150D
MSGDLDADVAVIGAGFTGLTAALHLAEAGLSVAVLEAEQPGWGASGRNGGFCCLGGARISHDTLVRRVGEDGARDWYRTEQRAVDFVASQLTRLKIEADTHSHGETMLAHRPRDFDRLVSDAERTASVLGVRAEVIAASDLVKHGMAGPFHGGVTLPVGFGLNPRKYVLGLAQAASAAGVAGFGNSPVQTMRATNGDHELATPAGAVRAKRVIVATNGYSAETLPPWMAGRYMPVQSNVIVTRPLTDAELEAQGWTSAQIAYDSRNLLHYFRLMPDRRFLFGMRGGLRTTKGVQNHMEKSVRRDFETMFPAWSHVETPWFWSGFACMARNMTPFAGEIPGQPGVFAAFAYHGNGVAMGSYAGAAIADRLLGRGEHPVSALLDHPAGRFPGGAFRRLALWPAYGYYALKDR